MIRIRLAYSHLNLRWNPFGTAGLEDIPELAIVQVDQYVDRLQQPGFALQFLGKPGRGKTTHILALRKYFPHAPYLHFRRDAEIPEIPQAPLLFLDDTQWLPASQRRRIFSGQASFVIGTLSDHSKEMRKAGLDYCSVRLEGLTAERLGLIIQRRIEWARRNPGPVSEVSEFVIVQYLKNYGDDLRAIFSRLYEEFQSLEVNEDGKLPGVYFVR